MIRRRMAGRERGKTPKGVVVHLCSVHDLDLSSTGITERPWA